jgi:hypothetical protein
MNAMWKPVHKSSVMTQPLQLLVLLLERSQLFRVRDFHATELRLPAMHRVLSYTVPPRQVAYGRARLVLLQNRNDLPFSVALALHLGTSLGSNYKEIPHRAWLGLRG